VVKDVGRTSSISYRVEMPFHATACGQAVSSSECDDVSPSRVAAPMHLRPCGRGGESSVREGPCCRSARLTVMAAAIDFYGLAPADVECLNSAAPVRCGEWYVLDLAETTNEDIVEVASWTRAAIAAGATVVLLGLRHDRPAHESFLNTIVRGDVVRLRKQETDGDCYCVPSASKPLTGPLAGARIPWCWQRESAPSYIDIAPKAQSEWLVLAAGLDGALRDYPYIVVSNGERAGSSHGSGRLVLVAETPLTPTSEEQPDRVCPGVMAGLLLARLATPDACWHRDEVTANFTIDDPNLVEPYGRISYRALVRSMHETAYHTTIAFIPWNYRRTHADVEALFKRESRWLSLAVHGNNHDGYEFGWSSAKGDTSCASHRLEWHRASVDEALRRMAALEQRTGLSFGKVMIFPHGIGTLDAIAALDRAGYLASANRQIVPLGSRLSGRFDFGLRPAENGCGWFPLMQRWWPAEVIPELAAFLGKPILIYAHERDFAAPLVALEEHVARINRLGPEWRDLAGAARSLYLTRDVGREESHVWMFAREVDVTNRTAQTREFVFFRDEVTPGGFDMAAQHWACEPTAFGARLSLRATLAPGERIEVRFAHPPHLDGSSAGARIPARRGAGLRPALRIALRRYACDWRDRHWPHLGLMAPQGTAFTLPKYGR
jgi:hypothetical protein